MAFELGLKGELTFDKGMGGGGEGEHYRKSTESGVSPSPHISSLPTSYLFHCRSHLNLSIPVVALTQAVNTSLLDDGNSFLIGLLAPTFVSLQCVPQAFVGKFPAWVTGYPPVSPSKIGNTGEEQMWGSGKALVWMSNMRWLRDIQRGLPKAVRGL